MTPRDRLLTERSCDTPGGRHFLLAILCLALCAGCAPFEAGRRESLPVTPLDPAHEAQKAAVLATLGSLQSGGSTLSGQNVGHADFYDEGLMDVGGTIPAVLGLDLGYGDLADIDYTDEIGLLENHWDFGGLVTVSFCPSNPDTGGDCKDKRFEDYAALLDPGTRIGANWEAILSNLANALQQLKDRDVIVLFRPLHESNGGWFWWGNDRHRPTAGEFAAAWRAAHAYLTQERQLDNLLWVYCANYTYNDTQPRADAYYPGDAFVDVLGLDFYCDDPSQLDARGDWSALAALAQTGGKVLGLLEVGASYSTPRWDASAVLSLLAGREAAYFLAWHSWPDHAYALRDAVGGAALLGNPRILNLGEIPW